MGARRSGREAALQMLFAMEALSAPADEVVANFWKTFEADPEGKAYADEVVRGVEANREAIDAALTVASENWRVERMARLDRNLLRLGTFELMKRPEVPSSVILDEAVELAKQFGTEESGAFVNGVLNRVAQDLRRKDAPAP
jgi:N utilization substance protein B